MDVGNVKTHQSFGTKQLIVAQQVIATCYRHLSTVFRRFFGVSA
jgi:hypothetical protein